MKKNERKILMQGFAWIIRFAVWTWLIQTVDVRPEGVNKTAIGFAGINQWFHKLTGVHMDLYRITDWLGLVPVTVCIIFGIMGLVQMIQRKSLWKVDRDLLLLGVYYILVIFGYLIFEMIPINYRPVLIDGFMEVSYPSSTTLLVLSVMPTLVFQLNRRMKSKCGQRFLGGVSVLFSMFMVIGRLVSGVHWMTDIVGSVMLSNGLFCCYQAVVLLGVEENENGIS